MLRSIAIEPTNACNLQCPMCYTKSAGRREGFMDMDLYKDIIDEVKGKFPRITIVALNFGGEPAFHPYFAEMIDYARGKGLGVVFNTNGTLLDDKLITAIVKAVRRLGISVHRGVTDKVLDNVKRLRKRSHKIKLRMDFNMGEWSLDEARALAVKFLPFTGPVRMTSGINDMQWKQIAPGGNRLSYDFCSWIFRYIAILWDGKVTLCCRDIAGEIALEFPELDVGKLGILGVWNTNLHEQMREAARSVGVPSAKLCKRCGLWKDVFGGIII